MRPPAWPRWRLALLAIVLLVGLLLMFAGEALGRASAPLHGAPAPRREVVDEFHQVRARAQALAELAPSVWRPTW